MLSTSPLVHPALHTSPTPPSSDLGPATGGQPRLHAPLRSARQPVEPPRDGGAPAADLGECALIAREEREEPQRQHGASPDRKSTRLNSSHLGISYAVLCLKKKSKI